MVVWGGPFRGMIRYLSMECSVLSIVLFAGRLAPRLSINKETSWNSRSEERLTEALTHYGFGAAGPIPSAGFSAAECSPV